MRILLLSRKVQRRFGGIDKVRNKPIKKATAVALVLSAVLSGCSASELVSDPEASKPPQYYFFPNGSAKMNLPVFENALEVSGAGKPNHDLAESIKLLGETGFSIEAITHTAVESKIGASVDSVSLAIAFKGECLIAQFSNTWLTTTVADELASGCLIGEVVKASLETQQ
jgi:hypothetical protein